MTLPRLGLARVRGNSMEPTLRDGRLILIRYAARARPGRLVIVALPPDAQGQSRPLAVKRLMHYEADGRAWIESDNQSAAGRIDSWTIGPVPLSSIVAVALISPWRRWGSAR